MDIERRRSFLVGAVGATLLVAGCGKKPASSPGHGEEDDVAPPEDLMREHGVLNRILLVYDESAARLQAGNELPIDALAKSADLIRRFIEQYHEQLEEQHLFPRFEKANKLVDLVATLKKQHEAGRALTDTVLKLATAATLTNEDERRRLASTLHAFARMYRPHEAREDTVLFPAIRSVVGASEFHELGEQFEEKEHELFGKEGFEGIVAQVATIEQAFGIFDLNQFTPAP